jgi:hypothetical protein
MSEVLARQPKVPSYRRHKSSGQAIVSLPTGVIIETPDGKPKQVRRDVLLGRFGTKESRVEYARVIAEWEASGRRLPQAAPTADLTINELIDAFMQWAIKEYAPPSHEAENFKPPLQPLKATYGSTLAVKFGPLALKIVRQVANSGAIVYLAVVSRWANGGIERRAQSSTTESNSANDLKGHAAQLGKVCRLFLLSECVHCPLVKALRRQKG